MKNEIFNFMKTIMPKSSTEMYKKEFQERHKKAFVDDIRSLSDTINSNFANEEVTVWHCCTSNGDGYYTVSNGEKKRFVHSEYRLECVGGCWSLHVYERLYMGQLNLMKFLDAIKAKICKKHLVKMPLKTLYISYILTNLGNSLKDEYYREEDKCNFEIAQKYQREFTEQYPEQIKNYNTIIASGGSLGSYYNGKDNYEYSCVSNILENAVSEIYKNRKQLEACELWEQARKIIDVIAKYNINYLSAKWIKIQDYAMCSECVHKVNWGSKDFLSPYCPHCGARMENGKR